MMNTADPEITVVIPTYRRAEGLRRLAEGLSRQTFSRPWEVVIVDDGSGQPWATEIDEIAASLPVPARVVRTPTNGGQAVARNLGWRASRAPILAFTDDDCMPHSGWLAAGMTAFESSPSVGVVQGRTTRPPGNEDYPYTFLTVIREVPKPSPWFEGCNLFFRRAALEYAGGFDERLGVYGEETSLGWSVLEAGWQRGWAENAVVEHELADRSWAWHLRIHFLERHLVSLAARHPDMRSMFWRPWAVKRENALFGLAVVGLLAGTRRRGALTLSIPYLVWLYPFFDRPRRPLAAVHQISVHAVSLAGKLGVGLRERTLLL